MKCFSNTANLSFLIMAELISWENWTEGDIKVCYHKNWRDFRVPWQERKERIRNYQEHSGTKGVQQFGSEILCRRFWVISCLCCLRIGSQTFFSQLGWVKRVLAANERPGRFCVLSWYFFQQSILSLVRWGEFFLPIRQYLVVGEEVLTKICLCFLRIFIIFKWYCRLHLVMESVSSEPCPGNQLYISVISYQMHFYFMHIPIYFNSQSLRLQVIEV